MHASQRQRQDLYTITLDATARLDLASLGPAVFTQQFGLPVLPSHMQDMPQNKVQPQDTMDELIMYKGLILIGGGDTLEYTQVSA